LIVMSEFIKIDVTFEIVSPTILFYNFSSSWSKYSQSKLLRQEQLLIYHFKTVTSLKK
jgi:hypothetical protein